MGKAKREFRRLNDCVAKHLHANVLAAFEYLDIGRVRRFARKTREYMRGYARLHSLFGFGEDDTLEGFFAVEKFVREPLSLKTAAASAVRDLQEPPRGACAPFPAF